MSAARCSLVATFWLWDNCSPVVPRFTCHVPLLYMSCPIACRAYPIALHVVSDCLQGTFHCFTCHVRLLAGHIPLLYMSCPIALHVMSDCLQGASHCFTCHVPLLYVPCPIALHVMSDCLQGTSHCFTCHVPLLTRHIPLLYMPCPIACRVRPIALHVMSLRLRVTSLDALSSHLGDNARRSAAVGQIANLSYIHY